MTFDILCISQPEGKTEFEYQPKIDGDINFVRFSSLFPKNQLDEINFRPRGVNGHYEGYGYYNKYSIPELLKIVKEKVVEPGNMDSIRYILGNTDIAVLWITLLRILDVRIPAVIIPTFNPFPANFVIPHLMLSELRTNHDIRVVGCDLSKRIFKLLGCDTIKLPTWGVDTSRFKPLNQNVKNEIRSDLGIPLNHKILLYTGRLVEEKNVDMLLEIFQDLKSKNPEMSLVICANFWSDKYYQLLKEQAESISDVLFLEKLRQDKTVRYYNACDLFVSAATWDTWGRSPVEAMACEKPVVIPRWNGPAETVLHEKTGYLVDVKFDADLGRYVPDKEQFVRYCNHLLQNGGKAQIMGVEGRQRVLTTYEQTKVMGKLIAMMKQNVKKPLDTHFNPYDKIKLGGCHPFIRDNFAFLENYSVFEFLNAYSHPHSAPFPIARNDELYRVFFRDFYG